MTAGLNKFSFVWSSLIGCLCFFFFFRFYLSVSKYNQSVKSRKQWNSEVLFIATEWTFLKHQAHKSHSKQMKWLFLIKNIIFLKTNVIIKKKNDAAHLNHEKNMNWIQHKKFERKWIDFISEICEYLYRLSMQNSSFKAQRPLCQRMKVLVICLGHHNEKRMPSLSTKH